MNHWQQRDCPGEIPDESALPDACFAVLPPRTMPALFIELLAELDRLTPPGDDATFEAELTNLMPMLRRFARSLTRDPEEVQDLVQDTLAKAWSARGQYQPGTNLRAWTFTIMKRLFISQRRRTRFHGDYDELSAEHTLATSETQSANIHLADVHHALEMLPPSQRAAILMIAVGGLSYEAAAMQAGIAVGTLKSRLSRGRAALVALLESETAAPAIPTGTEPVEALDRPDDKQKGRFRRSYAATKAAGQRQWIG